MNKTELVKSQKATKSLNGLTQFLSQIHFCLTELFNLKSHQTSRPRTKSSELYFPSNPRPISGTQPRLSYSLAEVATPSGEVVFSFGRQTQGGIAEDQDVLPFGGKSPRLSSAKEVPGSRKSPWSHRMSRKW